MALIDEVKDEIRRANAPKEPKTKQDKPKRERKKKTKEEIAAYIARKQAEEERRYLKAMESPKRKKREDKQQAAAQDSGKSQAKKRGRPRIEPAKESYCTKPRPKTFQAIDLPNGVSIMIIYMPGYDS